MNEVQALDERFTELPVVWFGVTFSTEANSGCVNSFSFRIMALKS